VDSVEEVQIRPFAIVVLHLICTSEPWLQNRNDGGSQKIKPQIHTSFHPSVKI